MPQYQCSICNDKFEEKYFEPEQSKCILHCEKNEDTGWYTESKNGKKWSPEKLNLFWGYIQSRLRGVSENAEYDDYDLHAIHSYNNVIFPQFQAEIPYNEFEDNREEQARNFMPYIPATRENQEDVDYIFNDLERTFSDCTFLDIANFARYNWKKPIEFENCKFTNGILLPKKYSKSIIFSECDFYNSDIDLSYAFFDDNLEIYDCTNINNLHAEETTFEKKVKIQFCDMHGEANFYNTKFKDLADFYRTEFNEVIFTRTDFNKIAIFSETEFNKDVDFKYTKFLEQSIFRDTVFIGKLNLRNTIFDKAATFLDITSEKNPNKDKLIEDRETTKVVKDIQVKNRETARIIKSFLDSSHNIIEANKFYALEMKEKEKELTFTKEPLEWIVFRIHGLSSNHSQEWFTSLLWIVMFGVMYLTLGLNSESIKLSENMKDFNIKVFISIPFIIILLSFTTRTLIKQTILVYLILIPFLYSDITLNSLAKILNPLAKIPDDISFIALVFKGIIAYLLYQFVVSVRQNTRRK